MNVSYKKEKYLRENINPKWNNTASGNINLKRIHSKQVARFHLSFLACNIMHILLMLFQFLYSQSFSCRNQPDHMNMRSGNRIANIKVNLNRWRNVKMITLQFTHRFSVFVCVFIALEQFFFNNRWPLSLRLSIPLYSDRCVFFSQYAQCAQSV